MSRKVVNAEAGLQTEVYKFSDLHPFRFDQEKSALGMLVAQLGDHYLMRPKVVDSYPYFPRPP